MNKVNKQLPVLAALVDFWWQGVEADLEPMGLSPRWRQWACALLLPLVYWEYQVGHTRCARRRARMREVLEGLRIEFDSHAITQQLAPKVLDDWRRWATEQVKAFQTVVARRKAPAIEPGKHCSTPYDCEFADHCQSHLPDDWVCRLPSVRQEQVEELVAEGYLDEPDLSEAVGR